MMMIRNSINWLCRVAMCAMVVLVVVSCGTSRKSLATDKELTAEERRRYDYYFLEAVRMKEKGSHDAAFELLEHCLDINPRGAAALYEIAKYYIYLRQPDKAAEVLQQAVAYDSANYWYKKMLGEYYLQAEKDSQAILVFEDIARMFPSNVEPLYALADLYGNANDYDHLLQTLGRMEKLDGKSEQISMAKFRIYSSAGRIDEAFNEIKGLVNEYPFDLRYQVLLGDNYMENNRLDEAYDTYQQVLATEPQYAPALLSMARYYQKQGNDSLYQVGIRNVLLNDNVSPESKQTIMRQIINQSEYGGKDSVAICNLFMEILQRPQPNTSLAMLAAQYLVSKGMKEESKPVLRKIIEIDPEEKSAWLQLLSYAVNGDEKDEITAICAEARDYLPDALEFYFYDALASFGLEHYDKVIEVASKGTKGLKPDADKELVADLFSMLGDAYHRKQMDAASYAAYDSALVYKPDNVMVLNNYAYYLSVNKVRLDEAEEMSYRAVKAEPNNATYLDTYAWILFEKGNYSEARLYIEQALEHDGDGGSSVVLEHAGDIFYRCGDVDEAVEYWTKALEKDAPNDRSAAERRCLKRKVEQKKYFEK